MSTVHLVLQGKGGVGKSFIAALLAQYLADKGLAVSCFDADPINQILAGFSALNVAKVDLNEPSEKGRRINPRRFDDWWKRSLRRHPMDSLNGVSQLVRQLDGDGRFVVWAQSVLGTNSRRRQNL